MEIIFLVLHYFVLEIDFLFVHTHLFAQSYMVSDIHI